MGRAPRGTPPPLPPPPPPPRRHARRARAAARPPPQATKWQIIVFVGFLEIWSEADYVLQNDGTSHYMRGGKPGYFPTFDLVPHPVPLNLWDPFGKMKDYSEEKKARQLTIEVNNGRLAMIGLFGFLAEASVPGSVPGLTGLVRSFDGNIMSPDWYVSTGAY